MEDKGSEAEQTLDSRVDRVEHMVAAYTHDHVGWLLALQAIVAVGVVRQLAAAPDPKKSLAEWEGWARQIVQSSDIPTSAMHIDTNTFRERAAEKLSIFFRGISVSPR